ncbi:ADP-ribose pyrophosphatase [Lutibaculum baratangense AMV1]|uniref:GDP-mannose pyrophosphatase n=2 Tax=Lutibaculum TaxID=1358438 RepID=V4T8P3_9HYPH|nr:ADP-ribose pyrophosphatase [Lutibaculum baratangense AMV1]
MRPRGGWQTHSVRRVYENRWIEVDEHQVTTPGGMPGIYGVVGFRSIAVGVVPLDAQGRTVLVGQYRYTLDAYSWEIPEGGGDPRVSPQESAARELSEETGLSAARWLEYLRLHTSNSVTNEVGHLYLAWDLTEGVAEPEDTEELAVRRLPLKEAIEMALSGEITDAMSLAALFKLDLMWRRGQLPEAVLDTLGPWQGA